MPLSLFLNTIYGIGAKPISHIILQIRQMIHGICPRIILFVLAFHGEKCYNVRVLLTEKAVDI